VEREGKGGKGRGRDVEGPGKWSASGPALALTFLLCLLHLLSKHGLACTCMCIYSVTVV